MATYTNFCCRSGGSNLNAGTRTGDTTEPGTAASFTYASGSWVAATGVFTVASGNPSSDGVAVGDFASVYADGSTATGFVGRVTARDATTITVSLSAKSGTAPVDGTNTRTLKIGGAWAGMSAGLSFPLGLVQGTMTDTAADRTRVNFKNDQTYSTTAASGGWTHGNGGSSITFQGYTSSYGDGGRATLDGGTTGSAYTLLTVNNTSQSLEWADLIHQNNGASGSAALTAYTGSSNHQQFRRCVFAHSRGSGYSSTSNPFIVFECEAFDCNQSNGADGAGFKSVGEVTFIRCVSHDNLGSLTNGFETQSGASLNCQDCIADSNGQHGFWNNGSNGTWLTGCDSYNNGGDGIKLTNNQRPSYIANCNLVKNGGWGINGGVTDFGEIANCAFGSGTQANTSGTINPTLTSHNVIGTVTLTSGTTPWVDPANGDFRISNGQVKAAGRGAFLQTAASYAGTVGYPDIGAAQSKGATNFAYL